MLVTHHLNEIPVEISRVILLKRGCVFADGPKKAVLTSSKLSELYEMPVNVFVNEGLFQATPG
eukprot:COSAG01_NODE_18_length_39884_cov_245.648184_33_plen_63_part_00